MAEREQLSKERSQVLQELQASLRSLAEARERIQEMDRLQEALMKRLSCVRQLDLPGLGNDRLALGEDWSSND